MSATTVTASRTPSSPAPASASGGQAVQRRSLAGDGYDAQAAALTPSGGPGTAAPAPDRGSAAPVQRQTTRNVQRDARGGTSQTASAGSFESLSARVQSIASGITTGNFANVTLNVAFPVATVPGLEITIGVQGSIAVESNGQKEFNCQLSGGAKYGLGQIININAAVSGALQLKGADLGASLVDAVKQSLHVALRGAGVDSAINGAHEALNNPRTRMERLAAWGVGEDWIATFNRGYRSYFQFFQNNGAVGFEASVGISIGAAADLGDRGGSVTLEARTGIEDVNNNDAQTFAELAGQVQANVSNSQASVRFSKRRRGGATTTSIEVNGQLSMPRTAFSPTGQATFMEAVRTGMFLHKIYACDRALARAGEGANLREALAVGSTACNLGTAAFGTSGHALDALMGIEVKVSCTNGAWTVDRARFKSMTQAGTGTGRSVGGVEANVQIGSFIDFTSAVSSGLTALRGS